MIQIQFQLWVLADSPKLPLRPQWLMAGFFDSANKAEGNFAETWRDYGATDYRIVRVKVQFKPGSSPAESPV